MIDVLVVAVEGVGPDIGIEVKTLRQIVSSTAWEAARQEGWTGGAPIDVCATLGLIARDPSSRLALIDGPDGERAILLQGRVTLVRLDSDDVLALPVVFRSMPYARAICGISVPESGAGRSMIVVAPEILISDVAGEVAGS